ncbi:phosphoribosylanthranilate isomerase [Alloacidobacterium dinghuense]|uniref:N-(5'-phosphoribosyl)anthranilate isomerase n=1 Tax=Alloacidobacterium dinghuense TaxID=2763107 RepID=A0A7G8BHG8_9BACT|nr:phosphoribosylanthranilate isomerase [Alloacidobacterium dinghuense]QNI31988.1 phosphoribosylanthranilate isomerase [Alloacidobacterium dinghuense]
MWIKICGNTNLEDAQLAAEAGADAVGFVFAESPRRVNAMQVSVITPHLPNTIEKYGVFVDADFGTIARTVVESGLTGVQLHASPDPLLTLQLRDHFGSTLRILQVIHYAQDFGKQLKILRNERAIDAVLIDSRTATAVGGTGTRFDWQAASHGFQNSSPQLRLIAAGGLKPENVAEAIRTLQPWGVDVSSGVESAPGRKDPVRVRAFVAAAKTAAEQVVASLR